MLTYRARFAAVLICLGGSVLPAGAIEIFGIKIFEPDPPETVEMIDPLPYTVRLDLAGANDDARKAINAASSLIREADRPATGRAGLLASASADYARIIDALYSEGRYGPKVSILIDGREASGLPLDADLAAEPSVVIKVDAGPVYRFGTLSIQRGPTGFETRDLGFVPGEVAGSDVIRQTGRALVRGWQEQSFALAEVAAMEIVADHATTLVNVSMTLEPGPAVRYGDVTVNGSQAVDHAFIRAIANLPKGAPFHPDDVAAAQRRLVKLDTFRTVDVEPAEALTPEGTLPIAIGVTNRKPRRFGFGATLSSVDGLGVEGFWLHRNILGRAERLRFDGSVAGIGRSADPQDYDYKAGVSFLKPGVFTPETEFRLRFAVERENTPAFDSLVFETAAGLAGNFSDDLSFSTDLVLERSRVDDGFGRRRFSVLSLDNVLTYEGRDVPLNAHSGYFLEARFMPFVIDQNTETAFQATLEGRAYREINEEGTLVLAGRAKLGTVNGASQLAVPPQMLFFSGGGGSVRGFEYQSNGVTVGGVKSGGRSLVEVSGEVRYDFDDSLGGVVFMDAGHVGANSFPDLSNEWRVGGGVGLRFNTGLGPLRLDVARALDHRRGDPNFALFIGLGQAF